ncbi:classical arabinogalactan protein 26-like [Prosopis cineraria]|uniref:classical arabinogalactan protein 26-like n=1 Tax=Prosopis cineraria TaxID=364024 RepID=UPI00240F7863|nr:classical arabinogalactan protein 26-like [Prosopis cineraria]
MASFWPFPAIFLALMASNCSSCLACPPSVRFSAISAAPTVSPAAPLVSAPLSPDIEPLFPSPGKAAYSPSDSSLPTIPASPSPPNPDAFGTPGSVMAFPPSESMPAHDAPASRSSSLPLNLLSYLALLVICLVLQPHGM